ncbi:MAG TPA: molybdenum ABC transporter ATP-binding protein [Candidatus Sulfotelmatobacter sp.]|nr:molybdenum ABC transporter ATP-binding protein [Candidatus Sulfotelmatobacter sp.]
MNRSPQLAEQPTTAPGIGSPSSPSLVGKFHKQQAAERHPFVLDVEFEAAPGFTILFGPSGAGKTTLLDCVAGLSKPDSGHISIAERVLFDSSRGTDVAAAQRRCGYVFQNLALFPHLTAEQNVLYGLTHLPVSVRQQRASAILQALRISHLAKRNVREISGGESQRIALARTLVTDPELLLLDEPLAALDAATKSQIIADLRQWNQLHHIPILYVTHSHEEVFALGERALVLDSGKIVAQGTPHEVMTAPIHETVAQLIGFENVFDAVVEAVHPQRGTMACRIAGDGVPLVLETPLVRSGVGSPIRVGIRAGDILLATTPPVGLSARNLIPGRIRALEQRDVIISVRVQCQIEMEAHLTLAARDALELAPGKEVWLVIKTHSCHLMAK